jgi:signal peptidase
MTVCMVVLLTLSMTVAGGQHEFQFVSSEVESESPGVIQQGTSKTTVYQVPSNGPLPIVAIIEPGSDSVNVSATTLYVPGSSERDLNVTIQAPPETGTYTESITEYRYLAFLPTGVLVSLHEIHPWAPIVAIDALLGILLIAISLLLLGVDPIRLSRREGSIPLRVWLRRWLD